MKNWKIKISEHSFTLKTSDRGVFFPIIRTIKSGIFGLLTVNYEEGSMPIKYNALFMNKQHPSGCIELALKTISQSSRGGERKGGIVGGWSELTQIFVTKRI